MLSLPLACLAIPCAAATVLGDLDLTALSFERLTNVAPGSTGTSNGIGWSLDVTGAGGSLTGTNAYAIDGGAYSFDDVHVVSEWTITFDAPIATLLLFVQNDNPSSTRRAGFDLGIAASDFGGGLLREDTDFVTEQTAGYAIYDFAAPVTSVRSFGISDQVFDGYDLTFFAYPPAPVPLPAAGWLLLGAVGGMLAWGRRRT
jgi:hypothetical protein